MELLSLKDYLTEAVANQQLQKVATIITKYLFKKTGIKWFKMPGIEQFSNTYIKNALGLRFFSSNAKSVRFNFIGTRVNVSRLHSVDIWNGSSREPNFNITFPKELSLIKTVPAIVSIIMQPHIGHVEIYPEDKGLDDKVLQESYDIIEDELILEAKAQRYVSAFDDLLTYVQPNQKLQMSQVRGANNAYYKIYNVLIKQYSTMFTKEGNSNVFIGDKSKLLHDKHDIIALAGGIETEVRAGASSETYKMSPEIEAEEAKERVPFKEQLSDLKRLVKLLIRGASNSLIISGVGGVGKCTTINTNIFITETSNYDNFDNENPQTINT